ncbi:hypothetical protein ABRT01_16220 [Lentibacillus sp. L22]|uniref:hypothetical protein n=1 Tax=Lentibacillus TaxID=175304 RepID=UPI0022B1B5CC|nr:hypothetical protein [Lentibacillus daqui]
MAQLIKLKNYISRYERYQSWFSEKRSLVSPMKNQQLKAAHALLKHCQTTSVKRPEWEEETEAFAMDWEESNT